MEGGEVGESFEVVVGLGGDGLGGWVVAAVDDAVAGMGDVIFGGECGEAFVGDEVVEDVSAGVGVGGDVVEFLVLDLGGAPRVGEFGGGGGQSGDLGFGELSWSGGGGVMLVDGDLHGRGAGVDGQNDGHGGVFTLR